MLETLDGLVREDFRRYLSTKAYPEKVVREYLEQPYSYVQIRVLDEDANSKTCACRLVARKLIWDFEQSHLEAKTSPLRNAVYEVYLTEREGAFVQLVDRLTLINFQKT